MKPYLLANTLFVLLLFALPAQAIILDDEPPKAAVKPKKHGKSRMELENERMKKELQALKRQQRQADQADEAPASEQSSVNIDMVQLPSGIKMGKYEVTQGQWRAVMGSNLSTFSSCDDCPVTHVSWDDVQGFIQRLNSQTGRSYRLPTEDEWYSACQAGASTEYCGSDSIDAVAWYAVNLGETTRAVGGKQANAWGLYDMSGNVSEWTSSCYEGDCTRRVHRGGDIFTLREYLSSTRRSGDDTSFRYFNLGFRLAQDR